MKRVPVKSRFLALLLVAVLFITPCASMSASAYAAPTKDAWYLIGDLEYDGVVDALDARKALRISAYLEAAPDSESVRFYAGDLDGDDYITVNDARAIARIAAGLDSAPTQISDPENVAITNAEALELVRTIANQLKTADSYNYMRPFTLQTITKGLDAYTDDTKGLGSNDDFKEMFDDLKNTNQVSDPKEYSYSYASQYTYGYKRYMEVLDQDYVVGSALTSAAITSNTNKKSGLTRTIRLNIASQSWTIGNEPSVIWMHNLLQIDGVTDMYDEMSEEFADMADYVSLDSPQLTYKNGWVEIQYTEIPATDTTPVEYEIEYLKYSVDVDMSFAMNLKSLIVRLALGTTKKTVTLNISNRIQRNYTFGDGASKFYVAATETTD